MSACSLLLWLLAGLVAPLVTSCPCPVTGQATHHVRNVMIPPAQSKCYLDTLPVGFICLGSVGLGIVACWQERLGSRVAG